jgi:hypothetical protein
MMIIMTIRRTAHRLGLPVRRDPEDAGKLVQNAGARIPPGRGDAQAFEARAIVILTERRWHRPHRVNT